MKINDLYNAIFEAINNKSLERVNDLLTKENIELLSSSYNDGDDRYEKICFMSLSLNDEGIFLRLCAPALQLLECGNKLATRANSVAQNFLPTLIKQLAYEQKKLLLIR